MKFSVATELHYDVLQNSTMILNVHAFETSSQKVLKENFVVEPRVRTEEFLGVSGESRFVKIETGNAKQLKITYSAQVETAPKLVRQGEIESVDIAQLPRHVIPYLFASRYCQSDRLGRFAWGKFGGIERTYDRVVAIVEWIHSNVEYLRGETNSATSAFDTITQLAGVCRDFAHLGIALCRALSIPARYFSGYAYRLDPPDFHACFEAFIGNQWYFFDATKLVPLNGLVRIATGQDAADAAVATIFGSLNCTKFLVSCEAIDGPFSPWTSRQIKDKGVVLDGLQSPNGTSPASLPNRPLVATKP